MVAFTVVDQVSKTGWLELAEARKSSGSRSVSRLQLPSSEGEREVAFNEQKKPKFHFLTWRLFRCWRMFVVGVCFVVGGCLVVGSCLLFILLDKNNVSFVILYIGGGG